MIQFFHVTKRYGGEQIALNDVSLEIARGQFVFLTGPSGAGKTTLLRMIYGEEAPTEGQIIVNGRNVSSLPRKKVPYLRRTIGMVFQDFRLIPRKTVFENVVYLPKILGASVKTQKKLAYQALRRVSLAHRLNAFPTELSGGEQQRVAIARALINEPELLIADEPTGNLDPDLSWEILRLFREINLRGTTLLIATHDRHTIRSIGQRVLTLKAGKLIGDQAIPRAPVTGSVPSSDPASGDTGAEGTLRPGKADQHFTYPPEPLDSDPRGREEADEQASATARVSGDHQRGNEG